MEPHARARAGARAAIWACARCVEPEAADLLVNCTSVGLKAQSVERSATDDEALNQLGLTFDQVGNYAYVVDFVYRSGSTQLLAAAQTHGARTLDGLDVLVAQGALSLELWTGRTAPLEVMRAAAREQDASHGEARRAPRRGGLAR